MTKKEKNLLKKQLVHAKQLATVAQVAEDEVFNLIEQFSLADVVEEEINPSNKPDWLNGDTISQAITCFLAYGEGNVNSLIALIEQTAQMKKGE